MDADKYFRKGNAYIWKETFAILNSRRIYPGAFANITDKNEITVIIDQEKYDDKDAIAAEKDWRLITFDMVLPFGLVGFLAKASKALADEGIGIFVVSAYSTDHILVKQKDLEKAKKKLEETGLAVTEK